MMNTSDHFSPAFELILLELLVNTCYTHSVGAVRNPHHVSDGLFLTTQPHP